MPRYGRRRTFRRTRRPTYRRKRTIRRRTVSRPRYLFKRKTQFASIILVPSTVAQNGLISFKLNDVPQYTDFTNLFDQYIIRKVKVDFKATVNDFTASFINSEIPQLFTCIDKNTIVPLGGVDEVMAFQNCRQNPCNRDFSRTLYPKYLVTGQSGIQYQTPNTFQPSNSYTLQHYGLQWACPTFENPDNVEVQVFVTFFIECRTVR